MKRPPTRSYPPDAKQRVLRETFGFTDFRPGQEAVVDALLAGENVLAVMPTGAGKSLCFQVPALVMGGLTVVVSPLVALMRDQVAALELAGVAAAAINSAHSRAENVAVWQRAAAGDLRLLYMAPERLMTPRMLDALARLDVWLFAIDEAHCISQWGPAFRPEYGDLARLRELFPERPIAAFTATADAATREDIDAQLFGGAGTVFVHGFDRPNIRLSVEIKRDRWRQILAFVKRHAGASGIVYCLSRKKTEATAALLEQEGIRALPYHAGMDKAAREANQNAFMTEPGIVMVATIAFGMGIDKSDIRFILHADMPGSPEAYYQEIGRAGRDGAPAAAHMLFGLDDIRMRRVFIDDEDAGDARKRREHQRLDALVGYCEAPECRRRALLGYFGEANEACGNCDVCIDPVAMVDGTAEGQQVLSAVHRTGQRFGAAHVIDVVTGTLTEKAVRAGHDRLPTFGVGSALKKPAWRSIVRQLVSAGFLRLEIGGYGGLAITEKGRSMLAGDTPFRYRPDTTPRAARPARAASEPPAELSAADTDLLGRLKELRLRLASDQGVPAYVVFPDRSLVEMAHTRPRSEADFATINGVGEVKLARFAAPFLAAIAEFAEHANAEVAADTDAEENTTPAGAP